MPAGMKASRAIRPRIVIQRITDVISVAVHMCLAISTEQYGALHQRGLLQRGLRVRPHAFLADQTEHFALQGIEHGGGGRLDRARPRELDRDAFFDAPGARGHDAHGIGEEQRLLDVVGDEEHGLVVALPHIEKQLLHQGARLRVQAPEGLVHEEQLGLHREHARDADALLHAAGELRRVVRREALQADLFDDFLRERTVGLRGLALRLRPEDDVLIDRIPRKERRFLEDDGALRRRRRYGHAVRAYLSARRRVESRHHVEERGFAAARWAEDGGEGVRADFEVDSLDGFDASIPLDEFLRDAAQLERRSLPAVHAPASRVRQRSRMREAYTITRSETKPRKPTETMVATQMSMRPT